MVAERKRALISYNDNTALSQQQDFQVAHNLANVLRSEMMDADIARYSETTLSQGHYQWLIFIYTPEITKSAQMNHAIETALHKVVERQMQGVLGVTTKASDIPDKWASIRIYDSSNSQYTEDIWKAMHYAKVPYSQAITRQPRQLASTRPQRQKPEPLLLAQIAACLIVLLVVAGVLYKTYAFPSSQPIVVGMTPKQQTATAMTKNYATTTATARMTPEVSPTLDATTRKAIQKEYDTLPQNPTIDGFQATNQWSTNTIDTRTCTFDQAGNYVTGITTASHYFPCMAKQTSYTNIALQATINIKGDAGGIIFRSDESMRNYFRLSINQTDPKLDTFSLYLCGTDILCTDNEINQGTSLASEQYSINRTKPLSLTVIIKDQNIDLFIGGNFLTRFTVPKSNGVPTKGQIGLYGASLGKSTTVTWSDLKIWSLDTK
jgi:hypothetical protein